ncbi:hypothetical protein JTE90_016475 [Oedothorax gibbosus]|uniref:Uncharacterized protein n=1 Tax=Oedothorax gibbosus TaxID=931172 RepID=A0AAV6V7J2_9ARAC|nr:hypothetical protein JTE90_016475 [Oedothorax gibbosus]
MEAVAKHDFRAADKDELSFKKDQVLKVLNMEDNEHWFIAELNGKEGFIPSNHIHLNSPEWYFGHTTRLEAEEILMDEHVGSFLIRISVNSPRDFSLSAKFPDSVQHFKVLRHPKGKFSLGRTKFNSLNELVEHHRTESVSRSHDVKLKDMDPEKEKDELFLVQAKFDFEPQEEGELEFSSGDVIRVLEKHDQNWWEGEVRGRKGCFPVNHVKPLEESRLKTYYNSIDALKHFGSVKSLEVEVDGDATSHQASKVISTLKIELDIKCNKTSCEELRTTILHTAWKISGGIAKKSESDPENSDNTKIEADEVVTHHQEPKLVSTSKSTSP